MGWNDNILPSKPDKANINTPRDMDGNTYLHELVRKDAPPALIREAVEKLGANINAVNKKNMPALGVAITQGKTETVACLLELGAEQYFPVNKSASFNAPYLAADAGKTDALNLLLARGGGAYVNQTGIGTDGVESKWLALHIAVKNYHYSMIDPLVKAGALVNEEAGYDKSTPLFLAIANDSAGAVERLLNAGADLERRQSDTGRTPLVYAAYHRERNAARILLVRGADVEAADATGATPLMYAADNGDSSMTETLLKHRPDVDHRRADAAQDTALMRAAKKGSSDVVKLLLKAGANPMLTDSFNKTALKYAQDGYQHGTSFVLEEAETKAMQAHFEAQYRKYRPGK